MRWPVRGATLGVVAAMPHERENARVTDVVDESGRPVGVLSTLDVARVLAERSLQ